MARLKEDLWKVATLYYLDDLSQAEIAKRLSISRSTVSRMLHQAKLEGIVQISINHPLGRNDHIEKLLKQKFRVDDVQVVHADTEDESHTISVIGEQAASYVEGILEDGQTITVTWGRTVHSMVHHLQPSKSYQIKVVQAMGATGAENPLLDGPDIVRDFAHAIGGQYFALNAPLIVRDAHARETLMSEPSNEKTLTMARHADVLITGIGTYSSNLVFLGYLTENDYSKLEADGATGFMFGHHFDEYGRFIDTELNNLVIGIDKEALATIGKLIAIAGGKAKGRAILGALRAEYIDVLITDEAAALEILRIAGYNNVE